MKLIAPSDVTDPPPGWQWAKKEVHSWRQNTGEMRFIVSQETPSGDRRTGPIEALEASDLMRKWNEEAKQ